LVLIEVHTIHHTGKQKVTPILKGITK